MTTWKPEEPLTRKDLGPKWPTMEYFEEQTKEARAKKLKRLRKRFWLDHGPAICRCVANGMRALNGQVTEPMTTDVMNLIKRVPK